MQNKNKRQKFDGPIPGENYTSDVKNYPWHRPPDRSDYVEIADRVIQKLNEPGRTAFVLALLETGDSIIDVVTGLARISVANGRMSLDHAMLVAGPAARMIEVIAQKAGIDYERGWEQEPRLITAELLRSMGGQVDPDEVDIEPETEEDTTSGMGFMSQPDEPAPEAEQAQMIGDVEDDEEETV